MNRIIYIFATIAMILINTSCYDREVIDSKEGVSLPAVIDLTYTKNGNDVSLEWLLPSDIPNQMKRPLSVYIRILKYNPDRFRYQSENEMTLPDEPTTATYKLKDESGKYRMIVKLVGNLNETEYGKSDLIYSTGQTLEIE